MCCLYLVDGFAMGCAVVKIILADFTIENENLEIVDCCLIAYYIGNGFCLYCPFDIDCEFASPVLLSGSTGCSM